MAKHWYQLARSVDEFLASAPFRYENSVEIPAPPERTWELFTAYDTLVSWTPLVTSLRWLSPRPFGVGTVRELTLLGVLTGRERYFRWDEGKRNSYSVVALSLPSIRRWAEDYVVEPIPSGSRLPWTLAIKPVPLLKPLLLAANLIRRSRDTAHPTTYPPSRQRIIPRPQSPPVNHPTSSSSAGGVRRGWTSPRWPTSPGPGPHRLRATSRTAMSANGDPLAAPGRERPWHDQPVELTRAVAPACPRTMASMQNDYMGVFDL